MSKREDMIHELTLYCVSRDANCTNCLFEDNLTFCDYRNLSDEALKTAVKIIKSENINDTVNHPNHYNREGATETIDEMELLFGIEETMIFCKLNAWKYRSRAMQKNGEEDMKKSDWYIKKYDELKTKFIRLETGVTYLGENL